MIYCTRKIPKAKYSKHKELSFCLLKHYLVDVYKETLEKKLFPNYETTDNPDTTYAFLPGSTL